VQAAIVLALLVASPELGDPPTDDQHQPVEAAQELTRELAFAAAFRVFGGYSDGFSGAQRLGFIGGGLEIRLRHYEWLATRIKWGGGIGLSSPIDSTVIGAPGGLVLGVGEELVLSLVRFDDPLPTLAHWLIELYVAGDLETLITTVASIDFRLAAAAGFRLAWFYAEINLGVAVGHVEFATGWGLALGLTVSF
jgi:hypothetical protein